MKDIVFVYPKEHKGLVKKIVSKLESDGISCWVSPRDFKQEEKESVIQVIEQSGLMVIVVDKASSNQSDLKTALSAALEKNIEIIPFVVEKIESNIYSEFFFNKLSWIDAYEDSIENAYELLIETFHDLSGEKRTERKKQKAKKSEQVKIKPVTIAIVAIIVIILGYIAYQAINGDDNSEILIGKWIVTDYSDNLPGHNQDSLNMIKNFLRASGKLTINEDKTFERRGFSKFPEYGKWELNPEKTILYLEAGSDKKKDIVNIEKLTDKELIIFVEELMMGNKVTTKVFFTKQNN